MQYTLEQAAKILKISDRALRYRIQHGYALAIETVGGYRMTLRQIEDSRRRCPKAGRQPSQHPADVKGAR